MRKMLVLFLMLCIGGIAFGAPVWRTDPLGTPPTTFQQWTFDDADNPALPEVELNAFGAASAQIEVTGVTHGQNPGWYDIWWSRQGAWVGEETKITLNIPNNPVANLYKEISIEMIFWGDLLADTGILNPTQGVTKISETFGYTPDNWRIWNATWRIEPNPVEETLFIHIQNSGAIVDSITVDTICIPEPTTVCLFSLGMLSLLRRKRA